jgi:hypothetical protein
MKPAAEGYLKDWATGPAASLKLDPRNLSIMPTGASGEFAITDASSGTPIVSPGHGYSYVTAQDLIASARKYQVQSKTDAGLPAQQQQSWAEQNLRPGERPSDNPDTDELARRAVEGIKRRQETERVMKPVYDAQRQDGYLFPSNPTEPYKPASVPQSEKQRFDADQKRRRELLGIGPKPEGN